ncbi:MAG: Rpn family recombination-promoting nuclease/putative transposase [Lachnospiraceae bacterium]
MSEKGRRMLEQAVGDVRYKLTNDYLFRAVLQKNEKALRGLIAALLGLKQEGIQQVEIQNPIVLGERIEEKTFVLDIKILLNNKTILNIEMQIADNQDWEERSLAYLCRTFDETSKGGSYPDMKEAIHISILDYTLFPDHPEFYAKYQMMNIKNHHVYSDKFKLYVLDLTQAEQATAEDRENTLYQWAKLFKAGTWEEIRMLAEKNEYIKEAAATMYDVSAEENIRLQCEARQRYEEDRAALFASGKRQGMQQGIEAVIYDNLEEGVSKDRILIKLEKHFQLTRKQAEDYYEAVMKQADCRKNDI